LLVVIAGEGDPVDDPTVEWPADRERVEVGRLELTGPETERERGGDILVFDPTRVVDGIELTDDPILRFRPLAYSVSVERRTSDSAG
jgi:catalase